LPIIFYQYYQVYSVDNNNCSDSDNIYTPKQLEIDLKRLLEFDKLQESLKNELSNISGHWGHRIRNVYKKCGDICNTNLLPKTPNKGKYFPEILKRVDCCGLWNNDAIDLSRPIGYPPNIPDKLLKYFNYNGRTFIRNYSSDGTLLNAQYLGGSAETPIWDEKLVDDMTQKCLQGTLTGTYGLDFTKRVFTNLLQVPNINGARVLVIGSENPWLESCVIAAGAKNVVTLEYGAIISKHPKITAITPQTARDLFIGGKLGLFDVIASYSSVEHSGLGRYGDALNPWGDLQTIARAYCVTKPGGYMLLAVEDDVSYDVIYFNAHRVYGPVMYMHLTSNWEQISRGPKELQSIFIFKKII